MGENFPYLDILLFALVAGFLILRLRSVLGRRDGHQSQTPDPFAQPKPEQGNEKVVRLPTERTADATTAAGDVPVKGPLAAGLAQITVADTRFEPNEFVSGARVAFEMVLNGYAAGDLDSLQPLLSPEVYANFAESIRQRQAAGHRLEMKLVSLKSSEITEAYMAGRTAHVTVKFISEQISAVHDAAGKVIEGESATVTEVTDSWTFARDVQAADPNWTLVATGAGS